MWVFSQHSVVCPGHGYLRWETGRRCWDTVNGVRVGTTGTATSVTWQEERHTAAAVLRAQCEAGRVLVSM